MRICRAITGFAPSRPLHVINKKGIVVEKFMGLTDEVKKNVETTIKRLLAE